MIIFVCRQSNVSEPTVNVVIKIEERVHIHVISIKQLEIFRWSMLDASGSVRLGCLAGFF